MLWYGVTGILSWRDVEETPEPAFARLELRRERSPRVVIVELEGAREGRVELGLGGLRPGSAAWLTIESSRCVVPFDLASGLDRRRLGVRVVGLLQEPRPLFADSFESGSARAWSERVEAGARARQSERRR